jgi:hypothetical protein
MDARSCSLGDKGLLAVVVESFVPMDSKGEFEEEGIVDMYRHCCPKICRGAVIERLVGKT